MEKQFIAVSGPVIIENDKVLLNKHGNDNFWKFLGGCVENFDFADINNSLEEACRREVKEEMGFDVEIIQPIKPMMVPKPNEPGVWIILIHYLAKRLGEIKLGPDIKDAQWFDINNLPPDCAPNIKPVIEEYKKGL
jgi:ADP-ribose pyrophosphatase YjhB (NUDIX family)